ncbi:MAG: hypothetical protein N2043_02050 [Ignavibacterium sp.]|nr:hypothetical protein [Ignavibacterium sp.]
MSIKTRQIEIQTRKAIHKELTEGRFPELSAIQNYLSSYFQKKSAGMPRFYPVFFKEGEVSNPYLYNQMLYEIEEDLQTSFEEVNYQRLHLMAKQEWMTREYEKIMLSFKEIQKIKKRIDSLLEHQYAHTIFVENFLDFSHIEFQKDENKNIIGTNAFVDLRNYSVSLPKSKIGSEKIDLHNSKIETKIYSSYEEQKTIKNTINAIEDDINTSWLMSIKKKEQEETKVGYIIELPEEIDVSFIEANLDTKSKCFVELLLSMNGTEWIKEQEYESIDRVQWFFSKKKTKWIQIVITKKDYDEMNGTDYVYYFGIKNINVYQNSFIEKAYLTSKPILVEKSYIQRIFLKTKEEKHPLTRVTYFVGEDRENEPINWIEITPDVPFDMNMLGSKIKEIKVNEEKTLNIENKNVYVIDKIEEKSLIERMTLKQGKNMWKVSYYKADVDPTFVTSTNENGEIIRIETKYKPNLTDWVGIGRVNEKFIHIFDSINDWIPLYDNHFYKFDISFELKENLIWSAKEVKTKGDMMFQIYVNNSIVQPVKIEEQDGETSYIYSFYFEEGKNDISILCFSKQNGNIRFSFDFSETSIKNIFGEKENMKYTLSSDFLKYTNKMDIKKFTIIENQIVVNYNPMEINYLHAFGSSHTSMVYEVKEEYIQEEKEEIKIRLMMILERENIKEITPYVYGYTLVFE